MTGLLAFSLIIALAIGIALLSRRGVVRGSINDVLVASGSFGPLLLFFIMVGEVYTVGTMLGAPGAIYARGAGYGFWFINYIMLAYAIAYFMSPAVWRLGRLSNGATVGDILCWRFDSNVMQVFIAVCSLAFLLPSIQLQLTGLGIVFQYLNLGLSFEYGVLIAIVLSFLMIVISGIRAPAYVSILKDFLLLFAIIIVGCVAIMNTDGGIQGIFSKVAENMPQLLTVPESGMGFTYSTVFFQMLGFNLLPVLVAGTLTSSSERNLRRNVIIMPIYMIMFPFLVLTAYFALLSLPALEKGDYAVLAIAVEYLPSWVVGVIAGGVALTATLVISVGALAMGGLFSKNILLALRPQTSRFTQVVSVNIVTGVSLAIGGFLAVYMPNMMATIITISYNGLGQLLVPFSFAFFWKRGNTAGIVAGMIAAILFLGFYSAPLPFDMSRGFCALMLNFTVAIIVTLVTKPSESAAERFEEFKNAPKNGPVPASASALKS